MTKYFMVDFAGTLIKPEMIDEANKFRSSVLERAQPTTDEHATPELLYKANREYVEKLTGLSSEMVIAYRKNDMGFMEISGEQAQNQIATNLFQIGMYMTAKKYGLGIIQDGFLDALKEIIKKGYCVVIVSGVRQDIISGMLQIAGVDAKLGILGQPPILGADLDSDLADLDVAYCIGDKLSDLEQGKKAGAKTIFAKWGHASGGEEEFADHVLDSPEGLNDIVE